MLLDKKIFSKISIFDLIMAFFFLVLLKPAYVGTLGMINTFWNYLIILVFLFAIYILVFKNTTILSKIVSLIYFVFMISMIANKCIDIQLFISYSPYFSLPVLLDYFYTKYSIRSVKILHHILILYVYINFLTIIVFPEGLYQALTSDGFHYVKCWFLGYKNPQIRLLLPAIVIDVMLYFNPQKKSISVFPIINLIVIVLSILLLGSATNLFSIAIFIGLLLISVFDKKVFPKLCNPYLILVVFFSLNCMIVVFNMQETLLEPISFLFGDKDISTASDRVYVWEAALKELEGNWIIGNGNTRFTASSGFDVTHPHNYMLYIMMSGGILALLFCIIFFIFAIKKYRYYGQKWESKIMLSFLLVVLIMGMVESLTEFPMLYAMFIIGYNIVNEETNKVPILSFGRIGNLYVE